LNFFVGNSNSEFLNSNSFYLIINSNWPSILELNWPHVWSVYSCYFLVSVSHTHVSDCISQALLSIWSTAGMLGVFDPDPFESGLFLLTPKFQSSLMRFWPENYLFTPFGKLCWSIGSIIWPGSDFYYSRVHMNLYLVIWLTISMAITAQSAKLSNIWKYLVFSSCK